MKNLFVALLIFISVMCFLFIPHGEAVQVSKVGFPIMEICQDNLIPQSNDLCIVPMDQMSLIKLNFYKNDLLCEMTCASIQADIIRFTNVPALAYGITVYKATSPRSFHVGK